MPFPAKHLRSTLLELDTVLSFGKHKGLTVEAVAVKEPTYLQWLIRNMKEYRMSPTVLELVSEAASEEDVEGPIEAYGFDPNDPVEMDW